MNIADPRTVDRSSWPWTFGVSSPRVRTLDEWRSFARSAEALGYDIAYVADHTMYVDPLLPLVTIAEATDKLRVGTLVLNVGFFHPLLLARSAATMQLLTNGRFELGIGGGWAKREHDDLGIEFATPGERVERVAETLQIVRAALHGDPLGATKHYPIAATSAPPGPLDNPPKLLVGGFGERLMRSCAAFADIVQLTGLGDDRAGALRVVDSGMPAFRQRVDWLRQSAGDRFADIEISLLLQSVVVTANESETAEAIERVAKELEVSTEMVADSPMAVVGTAEQIAAKLQRMRADFGVTHLCVFAGAMAHFAPVIGCLRS